MAESFNARRGSINNSNNPNLNSNKNKNNNNDIKKNTDRMTYIIIAILMMLLIGALIFAFSSGITFNTVSVYQTTITQSKVKEDGTPKTVTATYNVEVNGSEVTKQEVESVLVDTMNGFTYEEFTGDNAMENLKDSAMANLQSQFGHENVTDIYLSDYNANSSGDESISSQQTEKRNGIMGGLFKNMN